MTYRPGAKLVKIQTDPKVYAVSRNGVLHWVKTEALATALYGANWNTRVDDVPDTFFTNYTVGTPIENVWDINIGNEYTSVTNPSDNIQLSIAADALKLTLAKYEVTNGESVTLTAALNTTTLPVGTSIAIYDHDSNTVLKTCSGVATCSVPVSLTSDIVTRAYVAVLSYDGPTGSRSISSNLTTLRHSMPNGALYGSLIVTSDAVPNADGTPDVRIAATAAGMSVTDANVSIRIYSGTDNHLIVACSGSVTCVADDMPTNLKTPTDLTYFAIVNDSQNHALSPVWTTVNVLPLYSNENFGKWVFNATEYGTKVSQTHDQEIQDLNLYAGTIDATVQGVSVANLNSTVPANATVHLKTSGHGEKTSDTVTVEIRDTDGTILKSCSGTGTVTCETDTSFTTEYKNHFLMTRVIDQNGRVLERRSSSALYVGGTQGFGGSVRLIADKTSVVRGGTLQLAAKIMSETTPISQVTTNIYNLETGVLIANCKWTTECKTKTVIDTAVSPLTFYAIASDQQGHEMRAYVMPSTVTVSAQ